MRIGIVYETTYPEFRGGVEKWFSILANGLSKRSFQISYLNTMGRVSKIENLEYIVIGKSKYAFHNTGERNPKSALFFANALLRYVRKEEFDVLYLSSYPFFQIWAAKIAQILFRKDYRIYVEWFELPDLGFWKHEFGPILGFFGYLIQKISVHISDVNVCYLESTHSQLTKIRKGREINLRLPGICKELEDKTLSNEIYGRLDVTQLGRLTKDKRPILGLEAIKILKEKGWTGHFHLIGSGPLASDVRNFIHENKMSHYVTVYGDVEDQIKTSILDKTAVLVHPSKREGFGLAIIEAAEVGIPAVLIKDTNNKSTELGINPKLVSNSSSPSEIVRLLELAIREQSKFSSECLVWTKEVRSTMSAKESIAKLANHFHSARKRG